MRKQRFWGRRHALTAAVGGVIAGAGGLAGIVASAAPSGASPGEAGVVYVTDSGTNAVSSFSVASAVAGSANPSTIPLAPSGPPIYQPEGIAVTPNGSTLFVVSPCGYSASPCSTNGSGVISQIDTTTGQVVLDGTTPQNNPGAGPNSTAFDPNLPSPFSGVPAGGVDTASGGGMSFVPTGSSQIGNYGGLGQQTVLAVNPQPSPSLPEGNVYVGGAGGCSLFVYGTGTSPDDPGNGGEGSPYPFYDGCLSGDDFEGLATSPDGLFLYALDTAHNQLEVFDTNGDDYAGTGAGYYLNQPIYSVNLGSAVAGSASGLGVNPVDGAVYVVYPAGVVVLSAAGGSSASWTSPPSVLTTTTSVAGSGGIAFSPDGSYVFLVNDAANSVSLVSTVTAESPGGDDYGAAGSVALGDGANPVGIVVGANPNPVNVTVSTGSAATVDEGVTLNADVRPVSGSEPSNPTGTVTFYVTENGVTTQTAQISCADQSGPCSSDGHGGTVFSVASANNAFPPAAGAYSAKITATYGGDGTFGAVRAEDSSPANVNVGLNPVPAQWGMGEQAPSMPNGVAVVGQQISLSTGLPCAPNIPCPTGTVTFVAQPVDANGVANGSSYAISPAISTGCPNNCGGESFNVTAGANGQLATGSYDIEADYSGDNVYAAGSTSIPLTVTNRNEIPVNQWGINESSPFMPAGTAVVGQQISVNTNNVPGLPGLPGPTGTLTFFAQPVDSSGNSNGTAEPIGPAGGIACPNFCNGQTFTVTAGDGGVLEPGTYDLVADYSGDGVYAPASISIPFTVTGRYSVPTNQWFMNAFVNNQAGGIAVVGQQINVSSFMPCLANLPCPSGTVTFYAQPTDNEGNTDGPPVQIGPAGGISTGCPNNCGGESFSINAGDNGLLEPGSYDIEADYGGDGVFDPATISVPFTVSAAGSIGVSSFGVGGPGSLPFGMTGTFCCGVFGQGGWPGPTGTVTFTATPTSTPTPAAPSGFSWPVTLAVVNSNSNGINYSVPVTGGNGVANGIPELPVGSYTITATYSGDQIYQPQTITEPIVVHSASTSILLTASSASAGSPITYTATVTPGYGTPPVNGGTVTFEDANGNAIAGCSAVTVSAGTADCPVAYPWTDTSHVTAVYNGLSDAHGQVDFRPSTSNTITSSASSVSVSLDAASTTVGAPEELSATVTPAAGSASNAAPGGTVTFSFVDSQGSGVLGTVTCPQGGTGLCSNPSGGNSTVFGPVSSTVLAAGNVTITATYSGDTTYPGGASAAANIQVNLNSFTPPLALQPSSGSVVLGKSVGLALAGTVSGGAPCPTGTVRFYYQPTGGSAVLIGSPVVLSPSRCGFPAITVATGTASGQIPAGSYTMSATYSGDGYYAPASASTTLTVLDPTSVSVSAKPALAGAGQPVSLTASLTPVEQHAAGAPTGTITFSAPGLSAAVALVAGDCNSGGQCTVSLVTKSLSAGSDKVTATYSGGGIYQGSAASRPVVVTVLAPSGSGTLAVAPARVTKSARHQVLTFTYTAAPGGLSGGELTIAVPAGWTAPSTVRSNAGLVRSNVGHVVVVGRTIEVSGVTLASRGRAVITFGLVSAGGVTAPSRAGIYVFSASERSGSAGSLVKLAHSPAVSVVT